MIIHENQLNDLMVECKKRGYELALSESGDNHKLIITVGDSLKIEWCLKRKDSYYLFFMHSNPVDNNMIHEATGKVTELLNEVRLRRELGICPDPITT